MRAPNSCQELLKPALVRAGQLVGHLTHRTGPKTIDFCP